MADDLADDRWTVRGVPKAMREAASEAASRGKVTVGAWLCRAIDREVAAEREPFGLVLPPADKSSDAEARLAIVERAVASAVALAGAPGVPTGFRRRANKLLRDSLAAGGVPRPAAGFVALENGQVGDGTARH